jgi:uncharacterized protein
LSALADRIREVIGTPNPAARIASEAERLDPGSRDLSALGGDWRDGCFVVERRWEPSSGHGNAAIGAIARCLDEASAEARLFTGLRHRDEMTTVPDTSSPFVFLDLETTGLCGGAGTYAFLVGCGWFEGDGGFVTRQFVLTRFADERPLLETVTGELARAGALVSFNGKSFDAPLLETRYLFHRMDWVGARLPHVDVLHSARQFWKHGVDASCSLAALERSIVGAGRLGDVSGFEIPGRYFQFVRTGDARPLVAVLEHNRLDLLTLAALTARLLHLARTGPEQARDAREAFALGRVYARAGLDTRARHAFEHALDASDDDGLRIDVLRGLAAMLRRMRQYGDAAIYWRRVLDTRGCPPHIAREANEALAVHHEHRARDLAEARTFALRSLEHAKGASRAGSTLAIQHRLARLERKMSGGNLSPLVSAPQPEQLSWLSRRSFGSRTSARRISS